MWPQFDNFAVRTIPTPRVGRPVYMIRSTKVEAEQNQHISDIEFQILFLSLHKLLLLPHLVINRVLGELGLVRQ